MTEGDLYLVQTNEGGEPDVLLFEEHDTFLSRVDGIHHDVVEGAAAGGDGHVVLLIYGSEVSLQAQKEIIIQTFYSRH